MKVHLYIGLVAGLPILILAITGCVLVFEDNIDRALNPDLLTVEPRASRVPLQTLVDTVAAAYPTETLMEIRLPGDPTRAGNVSLRSRRLVFVDQYLGTIKGERSVFAPLVVKIGQLHTGRTFGRIGYWLAVAFTAVALVGVLTGLYLWWPRKILTLKRGRNWRRTNFDLHSVLGFSSSVVLLFTLASGVALFLEHDYLEPLAHRLDGVDAEPEVRPRSRPVEGGRRLTLDEADEIASRVVPGTAHVAVNVPPPGTATYVVRRRYPEDKTGGGRTVVTLDQYSGEVLHVLDARRTGPMTKLVNHTSAIHLGHIWGWPTIALAFLGTASLAGQVITGFLIWWKPRAAARA